MEITDDVKDLFRRCRIHLGAPVMEVELTEDNLCNDLQTAIEDYSERIQNWIIENNWATLYGKNLSNEDLAYALSVRTLDLSKDYSYWFSKDAGLQARGPWELKKDFFKIEEGKQDYLIPAGREINKVLWCNPGTSQAALYANYGGLDTLGFAGGYGQAGGGSYGPIGGFYVAQSMDIAYMATDLAYKNRLLRGDLTYNITAGPNGTRIIHLFSTPGSKLSFGMTRNALGSLSLVGCEVWYTYYDVSGSDADQCRRQNPDVILSPDQIPLNKMEFGMLNGPTQTIVRKLFFAKSKQTLAYIRGKFSGKVSIPDAELQMDYNILYNQGVKEYEETMNDLDKRLERMSPAATLEKNAKMAESLANTVKFHPTTCILAI